jgi:radical SAM protein with 4Fe4S-binding SPASM domain
MTKHYSLSENCFLKILEKPFIYNRKTDELYELDRAALTFLEKLFNGKILSLNPEQKKIINLLKREKLIVKKRSNTFVVPRSSPLPSLRYLELQLTKKCNLKCRHCYLGKAENIELPVEKAIEVVETFERMQGLKLFVSGGEPLLYSEFKKFNEFLRRIKLRRVLFTNGILLNKIDLKLLNFDEIQFSIDGLKESHNKLRGRGTYEKTISGIKKLKKFKNLDISIATMITNYNLNDFSKMHRMFKKLKVKSWGIDLPCVSGYLQENTGILPDIQVAATRMKYAFGGGYHGSDGAFICGNHLLTISPDGNVAKCGFYLNTPYGNIFKEDLESIWKKTVHIPVSEIKGCTGCKFLEICMGGCRFRADTTDGKDRVMCYFYGLTG